jgi:hypothetical protein
MVFFLMVSKGLKRSLPSVFSTRFSFDKSLAQILHHRFCIAVRRFLSILRSFLQIASLAFGRNGDSSRILKAFALPPIILDILATCPAIYHSAFEFDPQKNISERVLSFLPAVLIPQR